jgi:hypothetical protein
MTAYSSRQMFVLMAAWCCLSILAVVAQGQTRERAPVSTSHDDYAGAFRPVSGGYEFWFTSGSGMLNGKSRRIQVAPCTRGGMNVASLLPDVSINRPEVQGAVEVLDGVPAFSTCDGAHGVFVSNRMYRGQSYDNDIYEMWLESGVWRSARIDVVNSEGWDDTPSLSSDGRILFFASDRARRFSQKADIFYSVRKGQGWSIPAPLAAVNDPTASQECPYAAPDGYFYYATNRGGDYDIWRAKLGPDGFPVDKGRPLEETLFPGVNRPRSNETHPLFSPGGNWFIWSSSGTDAGDYDIFWQRRPRTDLHLDLTVRLRTRERDFSKGVLGDSLATLQTTVTGTDLDRQKDFQYKTNRGGFAEIPLFQEGADPGTDTRFRQLIVTANSPSPQFVASSDTLVIDVYCRRKLEHELFVWDTASFRNPGCRQEFPIYNVRFFVNGYWCPTTRRFQGYTPCASLFVDSACLKVPCTENELYRFSVVRDHVAPCVDVVEFDRRGDEFAREVDSSIVLLRAAMRSAFLQPCLVKAMHQRKNIVVEVVGSTDPRVLRDFCTYTGPAYDQIRRFAEADSRIIPFIKKGQRFSSPGYGGQYGGNQLLSDLRAYYTALLLDSIWTEYIPQYAALKESGRLTLKAFGEGVSKESAAAYERQRSIRVRVSVPDADEEISGGKVAEPGSMRIVCSECDVPDPVNLSILPPSEAPADTPQPRARVSEAESCTYAIALTTSDDPDELERMRTAAEKKGTPMLRTDAKEIAGLVVFRLLSGCYSSFEEAAKGLLGVQWFVKEFKLKDQPTVVKLK